jgi:hypothetical protein
MPKYIYRFYFRTNGDFDFETPAVNITTLEELKKGHEELKKAFPYHIIKVFEQVEIDL